MGLLNISQVKEGMKTTAPVVSDNRVVLAAGAVITGKVLRLLKNWGVLEIEVEGDVQDTFDLESLDLSREVIDGITKDLEFRFLGIAAEDELMAEIKRVAFKHETIRHASGL